MVQKLYPKLYNGLPVIIPIILHIVILLGFSYLYLYLLYTCYHRIYTSYTSKSPHFFAPPPRFHEIFQGVQRRDVVEPLALALLSDGGASEDDSGAGSNWAPRRPEILEVWEPFKAEDSGEGETSHHAIEWENPLII